MNTNPEWILGDFGLLGDSYDPELSSAYGYLHPNAGDANGIDALECVIGEKE
jgi:hypothetical protein